MIINKNNTNNNKIIFKGIACYINYFIFSLDFTSAPEKMQMALR